MVKLKWSITWIPLRLSLEAFPAQITQMPALNFKTRFKLLFFNRSEGQTRSHPCYDLTWTTPSLTLSTLYIAYIYWVGFGGWSIKTVFIEFIFPHWPPVALIFPFTHIFATGSTVRAYIFYEDYIVSCVGWDRVAWDGCVGIWDCMGKSVKNVKICLGKFAGCFEGLISGPLPVCSTDDLSLYFPYAIYLIY